MSESECDLLSVSLEVAERLRGQRLGERDAELLARTWRIAADPLRLMLLGALADGEQLCVCDLAWITGRADNLVSHHLRTLRTAGLVSSRKDGKLALYQITEAGRTTAASILGPARAATR